MLLVYAAVMLKEEAGSIMCLNLIMLTRKGPNMPSFFRSVEITTSSKAHSASKPCEEENVDLGKHSHYSCVL